MLTMESTDSPLRKWARSLKQQTLAVYFAARDPRTPWLARILALLVVAYALSPIDLIPDFVPVLGYVDDLIVVPLGLALVVRLVPRDVMESSRDRARTTSEQPVSRGIVAAIILIWLLTLGGLAVWGIHAVRAQSFGSWLL